MILTPKQVEHFYTHIEVTDTCWLWTGAIDNKGYGYTSRPKLYAHRMSYYLFYSIDPNQMGVLHKCDTPLCVNPNHLFLGTFADNMKDRLSKNRQARGTNAKSSFCDEDAAVIKQSLVNGARICDLARYFQVNWRTIYDLKVGRTWNHIAWPSKPSS
jgi:hypothetical protein